MGAAHPHLTVDPGTTNSPHEVMRQLVEGMRGHGLVVWEVLPARSAVNAAGRYRQVHGQLGVQRFPTLEKAVAAYRDDVAAGPSPAG